MSTKSEQLEPVTLAPGSSAAEIVGEWWWHDDGTGEPFNVPIDAKVSTTHVVRVTVNAALGVRRVEIVDRGIGGVSTRFLRSLPLGRMERGARAAVEWGGAASPRAEIFASWSTRPGRAGRQDIDYARVARRYVELLEVEHPTKVLAAELHLSESQLRNVLYEARNRELLTPAPRRGVAGGTLTPKALNILGDES